MPDWSYHPLFKPWVTRLPGSMGREFIHRGMNTIACLPGGPHIIEFIGQMTPAIEIQKTIFNISFSSPIGLSGKIDPFLSGTKAFSNMGFGFIEIGPITKSSNKSTNPARFSTGRDEILFPNLLESIGIDDALEKGQALISVKKPLFLRFSHELTFEELKNILPSLLELGAAVIIEKVFDSEEMAKLKEIMEGKPILFSIKQDSLPLLQKIMEWIDGIIIDENAVLVGNNLRTPTKQTKEFTKCLRFLKSNGFEKIPIIISGGVLDPQDAVELFSEGAELILLTSGYVLSGPGLPKRINEAIVDGLNPRNEGMSGWNWYWLFGLFIVIGGIIALFFSMTSVILPYDEEFLGFSRDEIMAINPKIIYFMAHDRMTVAGTMISGGILYMQLARHGVKDGFKWYRKAINLAGTVGFLGILLFIGFGYFDWLHGVFWLILLPLFILGLYKTTKNNRTPFSKNRFNHPAWKKSLWGQLCFVILGFAFVIGGLVFP